MKRFLIFSIALFFGCASPPPPQKVKPLVSVVKTVQKERLLYKEYVGHVEPKLSVEIKSQIEGILTEKFFMDGQEVKAGELLYTIDARPYQAALEKAEGVLAQNLANLNYSEDTVTRYNPLVQDDFVSQIDFDQYVTNVLVDEAMIQQNVADVEIAQINLEWCSIRSPMDGVLGTTLIDQGNYVSVGTDTLITINQIKPIYVNFFIPERDLPQVKELQWKCPLQAQTFINQDFDHPYEGPLTLIDNKVDENTGMILLQATYANEKRELWPGQFVDVRLIIGKRKDAIEVPTEAVMYGQDGPFVFVVKSDNTAELRLVTIGQRDQDTIIIDKGLQANETIVLAGQLNLSPGEAVEIKPGSAP